METKTIEKEKNAIKLIRGQRGTYGWEIKIVDDFEDNILIRIKKINEQLVKEYCSTELEDDKTI